MKIYLFLDNKVVNFSLPKTISGSFSFDEDMSLDSKLVNIEARDGKWILYSTEDVRVRVNNAMINNIEVTNNNFYYVERDGKTYTVFASDPMLNSIASYNYDDKLDITVGNKVDTSITYDCPIVNEIAYRLHFAEGKLMLEKNANIVVYVNDLAVKKNQHVLSIGDQINLYGFKIMILSKMLLITNITGKIKIGGTFKLVNTILQNSDDPRDVKIKDMDLYTKDDYFAKSPRIRRIIEEKEFKLSEPPDSGDEHKIPLILTLGPMATMGLSSSMMVISTLNQISSGKTKIEDAWPSLTMSALMVISMLLWPIVTQAYNRWYEKKKKKEIIEKYKVYLSTKEAELLQEAKLQKEILIENLITLDECVNMVKNKSFPFWNKRTDQSDFLQVRIGMGNEPIKIKIDDPERGFTIDESELQSMVNDLRKKYKYIPNVPVSYSFYENNITAIMGETQKCNTFVNNMILELISFYSYEDLKIVMFTNENNALNWNYLRYLNHSFNNDRSFRFFSSTEDSSKNVLSYLENEFRIRESMGKRDAKDGPYTPYYLIVIDDYSRIKKYDFIRNLTEAKDNYGFSVILIENRLSKLPSKCNNFITIGERTSGVLKNSYEKQEQNTFYDEVNPNIDMMAIAKVVSNIPIEFENSSDMAKLPETISFLEMEKVGKVEQLNVLNRWNMNDSTQSLRAEVGVNSQGDVIYLDLHEKYHGPHGLIAGTTGSGKSEFIITYILSMAINYSPDDVSFILIDYKGGGLAFAFENTQSGKILPHLAGTITNLDKAEMDRTLVSIDSELKRRQKMFNEARDNLGESTIDIYKYQRYYHEGKIKEPISHLFIVCDEFAELKAQQPDFMDSLISTARIGRSLGVHLILATQKPSGIVTDQIWSNTKFRVCLKVQDEADSKEMLKKPDAAAIREAGRFYLQVGYDELYVLGQSAWCGAKYFPSDKVVKTVDKSINFLNDCGQFIKSLQASAPVKKVENKGEQLTNIMDDIIEVSKTAGIKARKLWLDNIPETIIIDEIEKRYGVSSDASNIEAILGEYDAPEKQEQGIVKYNFLENGNTLVYGNDSREREMLLNALIYSTAKNYKPSDVNFYMVDYGSESLRVYNGLPHFGGSAYMGEDEIFTNLMKLITEELASRKKILSKYGGDFKNYNKLSGKKIPIIAVIVNNYDGLNESYPQIYEEFINLTRDSERSGVVFIMTCNAISSVLSRLSSNFNTIYAFKLKDNSDYKFLYNTRSNTVPRSYDGRGVLFNDGLHEFQVARVIPEDENLNDYLMQFVKTINDEKLEKAKKIPALPNRLRLDDVLESISDLHKVPVAITRGSLDIYGYDFLTNVGTVVSANKFDTTEKFVKSLIVVLRQIKGINLIVLDTMKSLNLNREIFPNYYTDDIPGVLDKMTAYASNNTSEGIIVVNGINKILRDAEIKSKLEALCNAIKKNDKICIVFIETNKVFKTITFDQWFSNLFNLASGIWVGNGIAEQGVLKFSNFSKSMNNKIENDMGYIVDENDAILCKLIDFISEDGDTNE